MINKQKVFIKIKEFIIELISEFFSNKKIIGMVILMIFVAVFKVSINGLIKEEVTETPVSLDFLNSEEKELVNKFLKSEINDDATKIKFSNFMKRSKGALTIQALRKKAKNDYNKGEIHDVQLYVFYKKINNMEETKTEWSSQKLKVENESNDKNSNN